MEGSAFSITIFFQRTPTQFRPSLLFARMQTCFCSASIRNELHGFSLFVFFPASTAIAISMLLFSDVWIVFNKVLSINMLFRDATNTCDFPSLDVKTEYLLWQRNAYISESNHQIHEKKTNDLMHIVNTCQTCTPGKTMTENGTILSKELTVLLNGELDAQLSLLCVIMCMCYITLI